MPVVIRVGLWLTFFGFFYFLNKYFVKCKFNYTLELFLIIFPFPANHLRTHS